MHAKLIVHFVNARYPSNCVEQTIHLVLQNRPMKGDAAVIGVDLYRARVRCPTTNLRSDAFLQHVIGDFFVAEPVTDLVIETARAVCQILGSRFHGVAGVCQATESLIPNEGTAAPATLGIIKVHHGGAQSGAAE